MKKLIVGFGTLIVLVALIVSVLIFRGNNSNNADIVENTEQQSTFVELSEPDESSVLEPAKETPVVQSTDTLLLYLIEEEKLAHDVYTVMYNTYGARVFGNILESESTHQSKVLTLLEARNIQDPRSSELGVFKNVELQKLYDDLVARGLTSELEAYRVGVAIEEKDIADISAQLAYATDQDVISILELLRSGSENHLRAFNKQI